MSDESLNYETLKSGRYSLIPLDDAKRLFDIIVTRFGEYYEDLSFNPNYNPDAVRKLSYVGQFVREGITTNCKNSISTDLYVHWAENWENDIVRSNGKAFCWIETAVLEDIASALCGRYVPNNSTTCYNVTKYSLKVNEMTAIIKGFEWKEPHQEYINFMYGDNYSESIGIGNNSGYGSIGSFIDENLERYRLTSADFCLVGSEFNGNWYIKNEGETSFTQLYSENKEDTLLANSVLKYKPGVYVEYDYSYDYMEYNPPHMSSDDLDTLISLAVLVDTKLTGIAGNYEESCERGVWYVGGRVASEGTMIFPGDYVTFEGHPVKFNGKDIYFDYSQQYGYSMSINSFVTNYLDKDSFKDGITSGYWYINNNQVTSINDIVWAGDTVEYRGEYIYPDSPGTASGNLVSITKEYVTGNIVKHNSGLHWTVYAPISALYDDYYIEVLLPDAESRYYRFDLGLDKSDREEKTHTFEYKDKNGNDRSLTITIVTTTPIGASTNQRDFRITHAGLAVYDVTEGNYSEDIALSLIHYGDSDNLSCDIATLRVSTDTWSLS